MQNVTLHREGCHAECHITPEGMSCRMLHHNGRDDMQNVTSHREG